MIDSIGEAQHREHHDEHRKRIDQPRHGHGGGTQQQSANQVDARAGAIDEEADRRLQHRRNQAERSEREAELGVAHAVIGADEGEQRRDQHHIIVADQVRGAHAGDELGLARPRGSEDVGGLRHCR